MAKEDQRLPIIDNEKADELVRLFQEKPERVVPFVGAGLSMPLFPSWSSLLQKMVDACISKGSFVYGDEMKRKIEEGKDYLDIASSCSQFLGLTEYWAILEGTFGKTFQLNDVPAAYREVIALDVDLILTTNYDRIPEIASKGIYSTFTNRNAPEASRSFENGTKLVFKLHGDITDRHSIILTRSDYGRIQHGEPAVRNFLQALLSTKTFLFLGFGMTDPHLKMLLEFLSTINSGIPITHYVLLSGLTDFEANALEQAFGIKIIRYDPRDKSHSEVLDFIRRLKGEDTAPPSKVSRTISNITEIGAAISPILESRIGSRHFILSYEQDSKTLYVSYSSRSASERELQNEFIQLVKGLDFDSPLVDRVVVSIQRPTNPVRNFDDFFIQEVGASFAFQEARRFATGVLTEQEFWNGISFFLSSDIGTPIRRNKRIDLPHIGA